MNYRLAFATLIGISALAASGQDPQPRYSINTQQAGKRFQIFFSPVRRDATFLVDTAMGRVWQRTAINDKDGKWLRDAQQELLIESPPSPTLAKSERFVIVFSPHAFADLTLLDCDTGETWGYYHDATKDIDFFSRLGKLPI